MAGQKRTRSGDPKPQSNTTDQQPQDVPMADTPPCEQAQPHSSKTNPPDPSNLSNPTKKSRTKPNHQNTHSAPKRPRLPPNTTISKRPLHHPALPTPFASAASPKVLYITASSPFIPACKRIRALLAQIQKRSTQSSSEVRGRGSNNNNSNNSNKRGRGLEANGRLDARDVEASIAEGARARGKKSSSTGEEVFLKATGRAIPRALELGVKFQGEEDCRVRVEMGNVKAIDDVEVKEGVQEEGEGTVEEEEIPETRIRTLSTVTVCIGLK